MYVDHGVHLAVTLSWERQRGVLNTPNCDSRGRTNQQHSFLEFSRRCQLHNLHRLCAR